jgi:hypothetical protein
LLNDPSRATARNIRASSQRIQSLPAMYIFAKRLSNFLQFLKNLNQCNH